jgi:4-amino-4-deoxychorismate lyase
MPSESTFRYGHDPDYELIETLRWERPGGFVRGELHLARMKQSAKVLGFDWKGNAAEIALDRAVADSQADMLRIRLTLNRQGIANCSASPFTPLPHDKIWRLGIATTTLDSSNSLLRHKTTQRAVYEAARAEFPPETADEVLLLNERDELCEGTITSLFLDMGDGGPLLTPALECGLLAGIFRGASIAEGRAREAVLTPSDLSAARFVHVGNSLRGLIPARTI